jgi:hypothetical protein
LGRKSALHWLHSKKYTHASVGIVTRMLKPQNGHLRTDSSLMSGITTSLSASATIRHT